MSASTIKPAAAISLPVIPEDSPFSDAQRAWLNGFFAGILGSSAGGAATATAAGAPAQASTSTTEEAEADDLPWHDPAMAMPGRLKLAEGKPRSLVLMAAMAQLDCGACGYACKTYAEAIDRGDEPDTTRCAPGGAETAKKLKELMALPASAPPAAPPAAPVSAPPPKVAPKELPPGAATSAPASARPRGRDNPFPARLRHSTRLNGPGSEKDTRHVVLDLRGSGLSYKP